MIMKLAYYLFVILYACCSIAQSFAAAKLVSLAVYGSAPEDLCASADNGGKQNVTSGGEWKLQKRLKVVGLKSLKKRVEVIPSESVVAIDERFGGNLGKADDSFDGRKGLVSAEERTEFPGTEDSESCSADNQLLSAVEVGGTEISGVQEEDDCFDVDFSISVVNEDLICERVCEEVGCCQIEGFAKETDCKEDDVGGKELESCDFDEEEEVGSEELSEEVVGCYSIESFDEETDCKEDDVVGKELESCDFDQEEEVGSEELSEEVVGCYSIEGFDEETDCKEDDVVGKELESCDFDQEEEVGSEELSEEVVGCYSIEGFAKETDCKEDDVVGKELESCDFDQEEELGSEQLSEEVVGCYSIEGFDKENISGNDSDELPIGMNLLSGNDFKEGDVVGKELESCDFDKEEVGSTVCGYTVEELSEQEVACCPVEGYTVGSVADGYTVEELSGQEVCIEDDEVEMELESCDCKEDDVVAKELGSCDHEEDDVFEKELEKLLTLLTKIRELLNVVLPSEREEVSKERSEQHEGIETKEPSDEDNSIDVGLLDGQNGIDNDQHEHQMILESVETDLKEGARDGYIDQDDQDIEIKFSVSKEEVLHEDEEVIIGDEGEKEMEVSDEEEWEGFERNELYWNFAKAAYFLECSNKGGRLNRLGSDVIMQFYGLQKVAMEGPCYEPPPMALKLAARAKWNAWRKLGSMSPEEAMENYINLLSDKVPGWRGPTGVE